MKRSFYQSPMEKALGNMRLSRTELTKIGNEVLRDMKNGMRAIDHPSAVKFADSLYLIVTNRSFSIMSSEPLIDIADQGIRPHIMRYLQGVVVPFEENGQIQFRKATRAAFARGKWRHPGAKGLNFKERLAGGARSQAVEALRQKFMKGK